MNGISHRQHEIEGASDSDTLSQRGKTQSKSSGPNQKALHKNDESRQYVHSNELPVPFCRLDENAHILQWNDLFEELTGLTDADLIGRPFYDLVENPSRRAIETALLSSSQVPAYIIQEFVWLKQKDGGTKPISVTARPVRGSSGRIEGYNLSLFDESHTQNKIALAEKERDELRKKELLQDEFIAVASHELRTPIQPILGYALLAKKKRISDETAWDAVLKEARRLQQLANDILDVSRIDSGALEYQMKPERINDIIASVAESAKADLRNEVAVHVKFDPAEADIEVELDRSRIIQVLTNLLANALKFTEAGSVTLSSKAFPEKNLFEIRVSDTGRGIPEEIQPILFEKFATKGHGDASQNKGSGLGLYICDAILKAHNGRISAMNNLSGGATFNIVLPISQHAHATARAQDNTDCQA